MIDTSYLAVALIASNSWVTYVTIKISHSYTMEDLNILIQDFFTT